MASDRLEKLRRLKELRDRAAERQATQSPYYGPGGGPLGSGAEPIPPRPQEMAGRGGRGEHRPPTITEEDLANTVKKAASELTPQNVGRFVLEGATEIGAMAIAPELGGPRLLARAARNPSVRAGVGGAVGSLLSEVFDPTEKPVQHAAVVGGAAIAGDVVANVAYKAYRSGKGLLRRSLERNPWERLKPPELPGGGFYPGADEAVREAEKIGASIPAQDIGESAGSRAARVIEDYTLGPSAAKRQRRIAKQKFKSHIEEIVEELGGAGRKEELSALLKDVVQGSGRTFHAVAAQLDNLADSEMSDIVENTQPLINVIRSTLATAEPDVAKTLRAVLRDIEGQSMAMEERGIEAVAAGEGGRLLSWPELHSFMIKVKERGGAGADEVAEFLADELDEWAVKYGRVSPVKGIEKFKAGGVEEFNRVGIKEVLEKRPQDIYQVLVRDEKPETVRNLRKLVYGDTAEPANREAADAMWGRLQSEWVNDHLYDGAGKMTPENFLNAVKKGGGTVRELFNNNPHMLESLRISARALDLMDMRKVGGRNVAAVAKSRGYTRLFLSLFPTMVAPLLGNRPAANLLTTMSRTEPGSKAWELALRRLSSLSASVGGEAAFHRGEE